MTDPVCGMEVDPARAAVTSEHDGETFFFCSKGRKAKFDAAPAQYPAATRSGSAAAMPAHDTPAHAGAGVHVHPPSPTAPASSASSSGAVQSWTCPMHPEVESDGPGACPICGMALEPRVPTLEENDSERRAMERRFWGSVALTPPLLALMIADMLPAGRPGERVPVDGVVVEGTTTIDESMVKDEPIPVEKAAKSRVVGGTVNGTGSVVMEAQRVGHDTLLAQIVRLVLSPMLASAAMTFSSVSVIANVLRLRRQVV